MNFTLYLPEKIYSGDYTSNEAAVYTMVNLICISMNWNDTTYIDYKMIAHYMYNDPSARKITQVNRALQALVDGGVLISNNNMMSIPSNESKYYTTIYLNSYLKIVRSESYQLYLYFLQLMSTRDNSLKVSYQCIDYISTLTGLSRSTIIRYNKKLEDIGVLYIRKSNNIKKTPDDYIYSENNIYGLIEDRAEVDAYADSHNYRDDMRNSNWQRMVTAKYNAYCKNPDSREDTDTLYKLCEEYNILMDELQKKHPGSDYIKKKKDLDVLLF